MSALIFLSVNGASPQPWQFPTTLSAKVNVFTSEAQCWQIPVHSISIDDDIYPELALIASTPPFAVVFFGIQVLK